MSKMMIRLKHGKGIVELDGREIEGIRSLEITASVHKATIVSLDILTEADVEIEDITETLMTPELRVFQTEKEKE